MIYEEMPEDFDPVCEVVGCFVKHGGKFLMLHRQDHKPQGGTWGGPAGKVDEEEDIHGAIKGETFEETGIELKNPQYIKKLFVRFPEKDFVFHLFYQVLEEFVEIILREDEHKDFRWVNSEEIFKLPLLLDHDLCIKLFYKYK